jgi:hypothetical protein
MKHTINTLRKASQLDDAAGEEFEEDFCVLVVLDIVLNDARDRALVYLPFPTSTSDP